MTQPGGASRSPLGTSVDFVVSNPEHPLLMIPVFVNGTGPHRFVLDTGASLTMLSHALGAKLGLAAGTAAEGTGAGGSIEVSLHRIEQISVGAAHAADLEVAVGDLTPIDAVIGEALDGILGYNFLSRFAVTIDYARRTVAFQRSPE